MLIEQEVDTILDTAETKGPKVRSNQIHTVSVRKEQRHDSDHQMNVPQTIVPGNQTYGSESQYGEKSHCYWRLPFTKN